MSKLKVLYLQPNSEIGGSDRALLRLVTAINQQSYTPVVVLPQPGPMVPLFEREGVSVHFLPMEQLRPILSLRYQTRYLKMFWPTVRRIARLIQEEHVDIVHTNSLYSLYGGWAARMAKRPHVWHVREIPPAVPIARRMLGRIVSARADAVVCMSHACVHPLFGKRSTPHNVTILGDGIDLKEFRLDISGSRIRRELGIKSESPVVGFVARLDPWKGLDVFLKAAAMLSRHFPEAHFLISGGAPQGFERYEQRMRRLAATLGLDDRVHFLGWRYALDDIPELMAALTVFSHTATAPEPFGLVLIEAMAMQRPVVAAKAGGPLEIIVDSESGFLTTPGNPEAHAEAVALLLRDPARAHAIGQAGRRRVEEQFSLERFGHNMAKIYNMVSERK